MADAPHLLLLLPCSGTVITTPVKGLLAAGRKLQPDGTPGELPAALQGACTRQHASRCPWDACANARQCSTAKVITHWDVPICSRSAPGTQTRTPRSLSPQSLPPLTSSGSSPTTSTTTTPRCGPCYCYTGAACLHQQWLTVGRGACHHINAGTSPAPPADHVSPPVPGRVSPPVPGRVPPPVPGRLSPPVPGRVPPPVPGRRGRAVAARGRQHAAGQRGRVQRDSWQPARGGSARWAPACPSHCRQVGDMIRTRGVHIA
jgi:hypothetical protein